MRNEKFIHSKKPNKDSTQRNNKAYLDNFNGIIYESAKSDATMSVHSPLFEQLGKNFWFWHLKRAAPWAVRSDFANICKHENIEGVIAKYPIAIRKPYKWKVSFDVLRHLNSQPAF